MNPAGGRVVNRCGMERVTLSWSDRISLMAMFVAPALAFGVWAITVHTQMAVDRRDLERHEIEINRMTDNQAAVIRILDRLEERVEVIRANGNGKKP